MRTEKSVAISIVIIAKNEENRLPDCLKSIAWANEIIVIDDDSSDNTAEIARKQGAKVYRRTMDIEGRQRNFGFDQATQPWILSLDADERISPKLAQEIKAATSAYSTQEEVAGFAIPVKTYIGARWIRGAGYYPARKTRLFRKGRFRYEEARVHPRALYEGRIVDLNGDILHYSCRHLGEFIMKFDRETSLEAEKWMWDGRKMNMAKAIRKTFDRFLRNYFLKGGWRDGLMGYVMSLFHGFYQLVSYAKYRELKEAAGREKVVFVDRDGVINVDLIGDYIKSWDEFRFHENVVEGLKRLTEAGYKIILISNQAGVGDGQYSEADLWDIHKKMTGTLKEKGVQIYAAYFCLHGKNAGCECRKPKVGLFRQATQNGLLFDKARTYFVGDKSTDVEAGKNFGLKTILVRTGYGRDHEAACQGPLRPDAAVDRFDQAVDVVLCG